MNVRAVYEVQWFELKYLVPGTCKMFFKIFYLF